MRRTGQGMPWRLLSVAVGLWVSTGCGDDSDLPEPIDVGCSNMASYYLDSDGDDWGEPGSDILLCRADHETGYTASNGLDCDDDDPSVTGQAGSVCPDQMVPGGVDYAAVVHGSTEFVAVHSDTAVISAAAAAATCGPWGWGGHLATFDSQADLDAVQGVLEDLEVYSGFVDIEWDVTAQEWVWSDGSALDPSSVGWCSGSPPLPEDFDPHLDPQQLDYEERVADIRLAVVKNDWGWCFGEPRDALPFGLDTGEVTDYPPYTPMLAHFICERDAPNPADFDEAGTSAGANQ